MCLVNCRKLTDAQGWDVSGFQIVEQWLFGTDSTAVLLCVWWQSHLGNADHHVNTVSLPPGSWECVWVTHNDGGEWEWIARHLCTVPLVVRISSGVSCESHCFTTGWPSLCCEQSECAAICDISRSMDAVGQTALVFWLLPVTVEVVRTIGIFRSTVQRPLRPMLWLQWSVWSDHWRSRDRLTVEVCSACGRACSEVTVDWVLVDHWGPNLWPSIRNFFTHSATVAQCHNALCQSAIRHLCKRTFLQANFWCASCVLRNQMSSVCFSSCRSLMRQTADAPNNSLWAMLAAAQLPSSLNLTKEPKLACVCFFSFFFFFFPFLTKPA